MEETINDRIERIIEEGFGGNKTAFCKKTGLIASGINNYIGKQRRSRPSVEMVTKIITSLNIDARWLLTGEASQAERDIEISKGDYYEKGDNNSRNYYTGTKTHEPNKGSDATSYIKDKLIEEQTRVIRLMEENHRLEMELNQLKALK